MVHQRGALLYLDGANMNAIMGIAPSRRFRRRSDATTTPTRPSADPTAVVARGRGRSPYATCLLGFFHRR